MAGCYLLLIENRRRACCLQQEELGHLRRLWGMVEEVLGAFEAWFGTPWGQVDVERLSDLAKDQLKALKTLPRAARSYEVFRYGQDEGVPSSSGDTSCLIRLDSLPNWPPLISVTSVLMNKQYAGEVAVTQVFVILPLSLLNDAT